MDKQLVEDTRRFLKDLNWFLIHIAIYLSVNIFLAIIAFSDFSSFWWLLFPMTSWSLILVYHALTMSDTSKVKIRQFFLGFLPG